MKKLLAFVVFALFSSLSFAAPTDFSSESIRMGDTTHTRVLSSAGVLTESTCVHSMQGSDSVDHCISQTSHLSKKQTAAVRATFATISADMEFSSSQASIQRQSDSREVSKSNSHIDSVSQSRQIGDALNLTYAFDKLQGQALSASSTKAQSN